MKAYPYSMTGTLARLSAAFVMAGTLAAQAHAAEPAGSGAERVLDFDSCAKPVYPQADLQAKHQGTVTMEFKLDAAGNVTGSKVVRSSGFATLDEAARGAIAKCRFSPAKAGAKSGDTAHVRYQWKLN